MANVDKILSPQDFQNDPKLQAEFGGDYSRYANAMMQRLSRFGVFNYASQGGNALPNLKGVSLFYNVDRSSATQKKEQEKQEKIDKRLDQISNSKIRAEVAAELKAGNLSDAFIDMLIERHQKKMAEFEEIWNKYMIAKGQAADLKKTCERLLREYQNSNDSSVRKGNYNKKYKEYADAKLDAEIYLDIAGDISHRIT